MLVVLSGPSGAGKGTVVKRLVSCLPGWAVSRSWTTRQRRPGEDGDAYNFVTREKFEAAAAAGRFMEWANVFGNLYGSPWPDASANLVVEIDVQGAAQLKAKFPNICLIAILPPGESAAERRQVLHRRLHYRDTDSEETIVKRLDEAEEEIRRLVAQSTYVVVNHDVDATVQEVLQIMAREGLVGQTGAV